MAKSPQNKPVHSIVIGDLNNKNEINGIKQCFDVIDNVVLALTLSGKLIFTNEQAKKRTGIHDHQIDEGSTIYDIVDSKDINRVKNHLEKAIQDKINEAAFTFHLILNNQKRSKISVSTRFLKNQSGNTTGVLFIEKQPAAPSAKAIDSQKDINLYHILANNIPDINLFMFDTELRFIIAEGNEMKNNGWTSAFFAGKKLDELADKTIRGKWEKVFRSAIEGKESAKEYKFNNYYYGIWGLPLKNKDGKIFSGMAITKNITKEKLMNKEQKRAKEEAEKANLEKSEFLARVSHEIRTPLNAIVGFTEQLMQTELKDNQEAYLKIIDKSSEHLLSLINDILILSKIEANQLRFDHTPFKIDYTIKYVYNALQAKANEKNLRFTYDIDEKLDRVLIGDAFRLRQILINMISNAIKFTSSGYVELKSFLKEESKDEVKIRFDIIDTGMGIGPSKLETIFDEFKQADSSITKKYGGTGLGLTICKSLIEMQNGSLTVSSQEGVGTTFTFVIPYKKGSETDIIPEVKGDIDSEKLKNKKVLLVDDDSVNRLLGKTILEKLNCDFDIAMDGNEAIEKLENIKYDLVLLDIHLPDISGIDVAKFLRKSKKDEATKIIAVTAAAVNDDIQVYFKSGINDFLIKPFKEINLYHKMCEVLEIELESFEQPQSQIILKEEVSPKAYNLAELKKMAGEDETFISEMLTTFIENSKNSIHIFNELLKDKNWEQIGETAHKILPSYRHLEVDQVVNQLVEIKKMIRQEKNFAPIPGLLKKTIQSMQKLVEALEKEIR